MWKQITKQNIKAVPVGTKVRINGEESVLTEHYGSGDYGFDVEDALQILSWVSGEKDVTFANSDWDEDFVIEIWEDETSDLIKVGAELKYEGQLIKVEAVDTKFNQFCARFNDGQLAILQNHWCKPNLPKRDAWVEKAAKIFHNQCMVDYSGQPFLDGMSSIYDSIVSGELEAPNKSGGV